MESLGRWGLVLGHGGVFGALVQIVGTKVILGVLKESEWCTDQLSNVLGKPFIDTSLGIVGVAQNRVSHIERGGTVRHEPSVAVPFHDLPKSRIGFVISPRTIVGAHHGMDRSLNHIVFQPINESTGPVGNLAR